MSLCHRACPWLFCGSSSCPFLQTLRLLWCLLPKLLCWVSHCSLPKRKLQTLLCPCSAVFSAPALSLWLSLLLSSLWLESHALILLFKESIIFSSFKKVIWAMQAVPSKWENGQLEFRQVSEASSALRTSHFREKRLFGENCVQEWKN